MVEVRSPLKKIVKLVLDDGTEVVPSPAVVIRTESWDVHSRWGITILLKSSEFKKLLVDDEDDTTSIASLG